MSEVIRVLVVDDSAYVRKVVSEVLRRSPSIEVVGVARDGAEALERVAALRPDVVTCDLNMPVLDGLGFIAAQMARDPVPIVVISIAAGAGEQVLAALDAGAVDFVQKPTALATERLMEMGEELVEKVRAAAGARRRSAVAVAPATTRAVRGAFDIVVVGISTGGPHALKELVPALPSDCPVPIAIVMHMPPGYIDMYARRLNELSALRVVEAAEDMPVELGTVFIAPAGRHLTFRRTAAEVRVHLDVLPLDTPHRPSVDALFQSAADVYGSRVLGVVMTGMGSDGREGAAWIKARGGSILTQNEESCVVYGMPRSVVEAGLSDMEPSLDKMAQAIMERV
ncbi:MAG TPA: chemotaxis-specific protein-glutamate methyltransferase CheB [Vicinamibacterales bacterium]